MIRGIGLSNDIHGNLLAPDSEGQVRAMQSAYRQAGWSPRDVDLVECHGAGTPLGDETEINSLKKLWQQADWQAQQCVIGSVKSTVGHLLTAAGAAGLIKVLLALKTGQLPPTANFRQPHHSFGLARSPFRILGQAEQWRKRDDDIPRRAAVSAFGFGGVNGHMLLEQWESPAADRAQPVSIRAADSIGKANGKAPSAIPSKGAAASPVAIIGMAIWAGSLNDIDSFKQAVFKGDNGFIPRPDHRWRHCEAALPPSFANDTARIGAYLDAVPMTIGEFRIPPNEFEQILPQHLLMLKVAASALQDSHQKLASTHPRMGVVVGMDFDYEATSFNVRWDLSNHIDRWSSTLNADRSSSQYQQWIETLADACSPPLTAPRVMGALGNIIASRIARELRCGGPSFVVSGDAAAGLQALTIGLRSLQSEECDLYVVGAVDMTGDIRNLLRRASTTAFGRQTAAVPFNKPVQGPLPGDGAAALVLKRLDDAVKDNDRIYAVIKGTGNAGGDPHMDLSAKTYRRSMTEAIADAGITPHQISYYETHGSGIAAPDCLEIEALHTYLNDQDTKHTTSWALGATKPVVGDTGAAAGLMAVIKTTLCLHHKTVAPVKGFRTPHHEGLDGKRLHIPINAYYWARNRCEGPRRACVGTMTTYGSCGHVVIEEWERNTAPAQAYHQAESIPARQTDKSSSIGLFALEGNDIQSLEQGLDQLSRFVAYAAGDGHSPSRLAARWLQHRPLDPGKKLAVVLVVNDPAQMKAAFEEARRRLSQSDHGPRQSESIAFTLNPLGAAQKPTFVYPGSGNHFVGMARELGRHWPHVMDMLDRDTPTLKDQMLPADYVPWRARWANGWEEEAFRAISKEPLKMIFGQVIYGCIMTAIMKDLGVTPGAIIGYSLGESTALFANHIWSDRNAMLERMLASDLFKTQLAGACLAPRNAWNIAKDAAFEWSAAIVNRPAQAVRRVLSAYPLTRLLITNTPDECVIGGDRHQIDQVIETLDGKAVFLDGVVSVHCDAMSPVRSAYRQLHVFPVSPVPDTRFYSCAKARTHTLTTDSVADSILMQAEKGFDFVTTVEQAYNDSSRLFIELGPQSSCTRMIHRILGNRPHHAISVCGSGEQDGLAVYQGLAAMIAERIPLDRAALATALSRDLMQTTMPAVHTTVADVLLPVGFALSTPPLPPGTATAKAPGSSSQKLTPQPVTVPTPTGPGQKADSPPDNFKAFLKNFDQSAAETAQAHEQFLKFSGQITASIGEALSTQTDLIGKIPGAEIPEKPVFNKTATTPETSSESPYRPADGEPGAPFSAVMAPPAFTRDMCMEFAVGSAAKVLGPEFAAVDTYPVRVRLPDEPLMLVDRILK